MTLKSVRNVLTYMYKDISLIVTEESKEMLPMEAKSTGSNHFLSASTRSFSAGFLPTLM